MELNNDTFLCQEDKIHSIISSNFKVIRKSKNLSLAKVGAQIGVSAQQVQKYESRSTRIPLSSLIKFANFVNLPVTYFLSEQD